MARELLPDNNNYISDDGDVLPVPSADFSNKEDFIFDHGPYSKTGSVDIQFVAPPEQPNSAIGDTEVDTIAFSEDVEKSSTADRQERLMTLKNKFGFYPQNNEEFNDMMSILVNDDSKYPALSYLDQVYKRQVGVFTDRELGKKGLQGVVSIDNPESVSDSADRPHDEAVRSLNALVNRFTGYAKDARSIGFMASELKKHIERQEPHNLSTLKNVHAMDVVREDPGSIRAMIAATKFIETREYAEGEGSDPLHKKTIINNDKNKRARIAKALDNLRAPDAVRVIGSVQEEQVVRRAFWIDRISEATKHMYVRGQAYAALRDLGIED